MDFLCGSVCGFVCGSVVVSVPLVMVCRWWSWKCSGLVQENAGLREGLLGEAIRGGVLASRLGQTPSVDDGDGWLENGDDDDTVDGG